MSGEKEQTATEALEALLACEFRGDKVRGEICKLCGNRGKWVVIYECQKFGECSIDPFENGQKIPVCKRCEFCKFGQAL